MVTIRPARFDRKWCKHCGFATEHECLPDVQVADTRERPEWYTRFGKTPPPEPIGLLWRCTRCLRSEQHAPQAHWMVAGLFS